MILVRVAAAIFVASMFVGGAASAHSGVQSYVYVSVFDDGLEGRVEYPVADLEAVLGVDLPDAAAVTDASDEVRRSIVQYTADHLSMSDDGSPWTLDFDGSISYLDAVGGYVLVPFEVDEDFDTIPRRWTVTYDGIIESNPERDALFLIEDDWQSATFRNEGEHLLGFSIGNETQTIELDSASSLESLRDIARRGSVSVDRSAITIAAITTIVAVAAFSPLARRDRAEPDTVASWRRVIGDVGARVGLVIVGQSISLWVIGLAGVEIGERFAMFTGALGVAVAAASWWTRGAASLTAGAATGVLLGVMVGGAFVEQQLHRSRTIRSLLAFDLGASATIVFVAALLVPLALVVGRSRRATSVGLAIVAVASLAACVWLAESAFDLTFKIRTLELNVADAITSPLIVGIVTLVVGVVVFATGGGDAGRSPDDPSDGERSSPGPSERIEAR